MIEIATIGIFQDMEHGDYKVTCTSVCMAKLLTYFMSVPFLASLLLAGWLTWQLNTTEKQSLLCHCLYMIFYFFLSPFEWLQ